MRVSGFSFHARAGSYGKEGHKPVISIDSVWLEPVAPFDGTLLRVR